jgi:hypothetical protein
MAPKPAIGLQALADSSALPAIGRASSGPNQGVKPSWGPSELA